MDPQTGLIRRPPVRSATARGISASPQNGRNALQWYERKTAGQPTSYVLATAEKGGSLYAFVLPRPDGGWSWATRGVKGESAGLGGPHLDKETAMEEAEQYVRLTPKLEPLS